MSKMIICATIAFLAATRLFPAEDDAEWRKRTGADPGAKAADKRIEPISLPGLLFWLDANEGVKLDEEGKVKEWLDRSGNGYCFSQPNASLRPARKNSALNSLPVVSCAGFHGHHTETFAQGVSAEVEIGEQGISVFALLRQREDIFASCLFKYGPDNNKQGIGIHLNTFGAWVDPEKEYSVNIAGGSDLPGRGFQILCLIADFAQGVGEIHQNGVCVGRIKRPEGFKVVSKGLFQLGGGRVAYTNCAGSCMSDIAEFIVFNRPLSAVERRQIEIYLQNRWGISALNWITPLASCLPFAYYPSTNELELAFDKDAPLLKEYFGSCHRQPGAEAVELSPGLAWATWKEKADPAKEKPETNGIVNTLDIPRPEFDPPANIPYAIAGWIDIPEDGVYTFMLRPQSASILYIADKLVADQSKSKDTWGTWNWRGDGIALKAGKHRFFLIGAAQPRRIEHAKIPLVLWRGPGFLRQPIPAERLFCSKEENFAMPKTSRQYETADTPALARISEVEFAVRDCSSGKMLESAQNKGKGAKSAKPSGILKLDVDGRGQAKFCIGDLPDGEYEIVYRLGGTEVVHPQTFLRIHFPWENNDLGKTHEVFPPFVPVAVEDSKVKVVDREYTINALGMFDSCRSQGCEILAGPMQIFLKIDGKEAVLNPSSVSGKIIHPDTAEFRGSAACQALTIAAKTTVEEDGCCRVEWRIKPNGKPVTIEWLEIVVPLKESEARLVGWSAQDSMRHHYWGKVPPKGEIIWDTEQGKAPGWVPAAWTLGKGSAPADGRVWDSTRNLHWTRGNNDPFVCYVWLGSEERGLGWFADRPGQFAHDGKTPIQLVCREPGKVVLRVGVIQIPTTIDKERSLVFGLQASPTKPLRPDWRTHHVPGGGGLPVVPWGGYFCSSKYPDNRDYAVVDQIMRMATEYRDGLEQEVKEALKALDAKRIWKDLKVHGTDDWCGNTLFHFVSQARWQNCCAYVEEHATYCRQPEWWVFQDEWAAHEFNRFQLREGSEGVIAPSYHDFCVYYQNEYMRRGVSLYYDNSYPRQERNPFVLAGERDTAAGMWGLRAYYKRTWKQMQRLMRDNVPPLPLDFTIHVTNCKILPWHTWCTNILDLEQPYRTDPERSIQQKEGGKGEGSWMSQGRGLRLPFPPDYTRAMTSGRHIGAISHGMFPLANYNDYRDKETSQWSEEMVLADWAMYQVHEVRGAFYADWRREWKQWKSFRDALRATGYGSGEERVINYWQPQPPIRVESGEDVTWIAVLPPAGKAPAGVLGVILLQSYAFDAVKARVSWQGAKSFVDHRARQKVAESENADIALPGVFGTALLWAMAEPDAMPPD